MTSLTGQLWHPGRMWSEGGNHGKLCTHLQGSQIWHPNWVRWCPNGTNLGLFKISFSTFLKRPKFVQLGVILTQFGCQIWDPWRLEDVWERQAVFVLDTASYHVQFDTLSVSHLFCVFLIFVRKTNFVFYFILTCICVIDKWMHLLYTKHTG